MLCDGNPVEIVGTQLENIGVRTLRDRLMVMLDATGISLAYISPSSGMWRLTGHEHGDTRQVIAMSDGHDAAGKRQQWMGIIGMLAALLLASAGPGHAWHGRHRFGGLHVFIGPPIVAPFEPYWAPYGYPPVAVEPPPRPMSNHHRRSMSSLLPRHFGTIARIRKATIRMANSAPEDGARSPQRRPRRNPNEIHQGIRKNPQLCPQNGTRPRLR
jgi:hypothetical protein